MRAISRRRYGGNGNEVFALTSSIEHNVRSAVETMLLIQMLVPFTSGKGLLCLASPFLQSCELPLPPTLCLLLLRITRSITSAFPRLG